MPPSPLQSLFKIFFIDYFWLHEVFTVACRLSLAVVSGGYSRVGVQGLLIVVASLVVAHGLSCPEACGTSQTRDWTNDPCVDRQTPNQWTTREVPDCSVLTPMSDPSQREGKWKSLRPSLQPHGILQARRLEWVNVPLFPNTGIKPRSPTLRADSLPAEPQGKPKNTGVGSLSLLQWIFPTQESNWGLLHCRWITNWAIREAQRGRKEMISWRWDSSLSAYQRF